MQTVDEQAGIYSTPEIKFDINNTFHFVNLSSTKIDALSPISFNGNSFGFTSNNGVSTSSKEGKYSFLLLLSIFLIE